MALIYTRIYAQPVEFRAGAIAPAYARFWLAGTVDGFCRRS